MHPEVARRFGDRVDELRATDRVVVYVSPLLVELGLAPAFDVVIVVTGVPASAGLPGGVRSRSLARRGTRPDGRAGHGRATEEVADVLIDNDGSLADLEPQVDRLWSDLVAARAA